MLIKQLESKLDRLNFCFDE